VTTAEPAGVRLGPADVGARVVVRRRLAEGQYGDVLGELLAWSAEVVVRDRHGVTHAIAKHDVVLGKRIPPAPERR
jgi:hypothetical protein